MHAPWGELSEKKMQKRKRAINLYIGLASIALLGFLGWQLSISLSSLNTQNTNLLNKDGTQDIIEAMNNITKIESDLEKEIRLNEEEREASRKALGDTFEQMITNLEKNTETEQTQNVVTEESDEQQTSPPTEQEESQKEKDVETEQQESPKPDQNTKEVIETNDSEWSFN